MPAPSILLHPLPAADGSTAFSTASGYTVLASVNGPLEVSRRDERPAAATLEVHLRPAAGPGGPRERWLEAQVHAALASPSGGVLLLDRLPRTLIQVTLQVVGEPGTAAQWAGQSVASGGSKMTLEDLALLPALWNAAALACVDAGLPMGTTLTATLAAVEGETEGVVLSGSPQRTLDAKALARATSVHALAFTGKGALLCAQSAGRFNLDGFEAVVDAAQAECVGALGRGDKQQQEPEDGDGDAAMADHHDAETNGPWLRRALQDRADAVNAWRAEVS